MATAYHLEALRKQRVLERAVEARKRMQVYTVSIKYTGQLTR